jgi:hypothetical protein
MNCMVEYDATGIVTAARPYRAGRAVVIYGRYTNTTNREKKNIVEIMKMF